MEWPNEMTLRGRAREAAHLAAKEKGFFLDCSWYQEQARWIKSIQPEGVTFAQAAGVVALLSPMVSWESQLKYTAGVLHQLNRGDDYLDLKHPGFNGSKKKAWRWFHGEPGVMKGPKVKAFYENLCGNLDRVTIDSQMLDLMTGSTPETRMSLTALRYRQLGLIVADLSAEMSLYPAELQAGLWSWWRRNKVSRVD